MKILEELFGQWLREDPKRLVEAARQQGERIVEMTRQIERQSKEIDLLRAQLEVKNRRVEELAKALEDAQRAACRQAAPFRVEEQRRAALPKPPGRKKGHPGAFRPKPSSVDEVIDVRLDRCPHCGGGDFINEVPIEQFIEEIPELRPRVTRLTTYEATCACCSRKIRSSHPLQVSLATGAAGTHLGARALAFAADLNKAKGLTTRKTCAVLRDGFGLNLSAGGLSQALARLATKVEPKYEALALELREASVAHSDETSWWVGGPGWWLWVFTNATTTFYYVGESRGRAVIHDTLGAQFPGTLVSDCLAVYDDASPCQQKCYSHHFRAIKKAMEAHPKKGEGFLSDLKNLLKEAMEIKAAKPQLTAGQFNAMKALLQSRALKLLGSQREEPSEEAVRKRLFKQIDHLFTFLDHDEVDATNNLAERQLRPAVIARKVSCGNKTPKGAHTWEILSSIAATCVQRAESFIDFLARAAPLNGSV